jgi:heat shock protein HslJ
MVHRWLIPASLLLLAAVAGGGCSGRNAGADPEPRPQVPDGSFVSNSVTEDGQPKPLVGGEPIRLRFDAGRLDAVAGCNHLGGPVDTGGGQLTITELSSTSMACDQLRMEQDAWLGRFLQARPTWRLDGDRLTLRSGKTELRFVDARKADPDRALRDTRWSVESLLAGESVSSAPAGTTAHLTFSAGDQVVGFTGCNSLRGPVTVRGDRIRFGELAVTRKACRDEVNQLEAAVVAVLGAEVTFRIEGDLLTLTTPDGRGLQLRAGS